MRPRFLLGKLGKLGKRKCRNRPEVSIVPPGMSDCRLRV